MQCNMAEALEASPWTVGPGRSRAVDPVASRQTCISRNGRAIAEHEQKGKRMVDTRAEGGGNLKRFEDEESLGTIRKD